MAHLVVPLAALVLALANPSPAASAPDTAGVFGEVLDILVVNLEVVVTDRDGRRVPGLRPEDFRLRVEGVDTPIDYFTEVRDGRTLEVEEAQPGTTHPAPPAAAPGGSAVPNRYLVFVDDFFSVKAQRDPVLEDLGRQLDRLGPGAEMALVAFDGRRLEVLSGWTRSKETLGDALERASARPALGLERIAERRRLLSDVGLRQQRRQAFRNELPSGAREAYGHDIATTLSAEQRAYASLLAAQVEQVTEAAAVAMRSLAEGPGRKILLLLAGGWPYEPVEVAAEADRSWSQAVLADTDIPSGERLLRPVLEAANRLGYTVYPVDVPGLQGSGGNIEEIEPATTTSEQFPAGRPVPLLRDHVVEASLLHIARDTGGKAFLNNRRGLALAEAVEDTRSYYWLGFTPELRKDDEVRKIRVDVLRKGLRARSRRSFQDLSRGSQVASQVEGYLLQEVPESARFPVRAGPVKPGRRGQLVLPLTLAIPVRQITLLRQGDAYVGHLELRLAARDDRGGRSEIPVLPLDLRAAKEPAADGFIRYDTEVTLRSEPQDMVVAIHDPASGVLLAERVRVEP